VGQLDLLLNKRVCLVVQLCPDLLSDLLVLLKLQNLISVLTVEDLKCLLKPFPICVLLGDPSLRHLKLRLNLLRLSQVAQPQGSCLSSRLKVRRNVVEDGYSQLFFDRFRNRLRRVVVWIEDLVIPLGEGGDRHDKPLLVRVVTLAELNAALDVHGVEVPLQLLDHDYLCRGSRALTVNHLVSLHAEDRSVVNLGQSLAVYELAVEVGQTESFSGHQLVHRGQVFQALASSAGAGAPRRLSVNVCRVVHFRVESLHISI
jgi:hypothetical protein